MTLRVLTISKPYVADAYREKLRVLARDPKLEVGLIVPHSWAGQVYEQNFSETYWQKQLPIVLDGRNHFFWFRGLESAIREFAPDVLNIEEEHYSAVTYQCFRIAVRLKIPACFYTWQNIYKRYPPPFSWIEKFVFEHSRIAVAGNLEAKGVLQRKNYQGDIVVIPQMGASLPEKLDKKPNQVFTVVYAGRLVEEKGIDDMVRALPLLRDLNIVVKIIGKGPMESSIRTLADELNVRDKIEFVGSVPSQDMANIYQASDLLCLPSRTRKNWKEQFGRVLIEAMGYGVIPVGSDSGEIPNVIGDSGKVFPEGDSQALANQIRSLHQMSPVERVELQERARLRVARHFTHQVIADQFADVFFRLATRS